MKIYTRSEAIRRAVRELLSVPGDERVIAVAYVGRDAASYLLAPGGISLYCWPQAGGTNPYAVEDLVSRGVQVHFAPRLHAKVYWSRANGALIGSANLTRNALGEDGLQEVVVWVPARQFDIKKFVHSLEIEPDFDAALRRLHSAHLKFMQRAPFRAESLPSATAPTFAEWMDSGNGAAWRFGWYDDPATAPKDALRQLEEATGTTKHATFLAVERASTLRDDCFTLSCRVRKERRTYSISRPYWWLPETCVSTDDKRWADNPHLWFARRKIPPGTRPPFDAQERRFVRALTLAARELTDDEWNRSVRPTKVFLKRLRAHYDEG